MSKPWVYIASPYTKGDVAINVRASYIAFDYLMRTGKVWPFSPLVSHEIHKVHPQPYQVWIDYDLAIIAKMDACLRIAADFGPMNYYQYESAGADGEVALFEKLGKPVFRDTASLLQWAVNL